METPLFASLFLDLAVDKLLDYEVPPQWRESIRRGSRVKVPLRNQHCSATVIELKEQSSSKKIFFIEELYSDNLSIPTDLLDLGIWITSYYGSSFSKTVRLLSPPIEQKRRKKRESLFVRPLLSRSALAKKYILFRGGAAKAIELLLKQPKGMILSELLKKGSISRSSVDRLAQKNLVSLSSLTEERALLDKHDFLPTKEKKLSKEQAAIVDRILESISKNCFETHLIYGVTGSGKTEIYLQTIGRVLKAGKSVLFLVPEISLITQVAEQLKSRFQQKIAVVHHRLTESKREENWNQVRSGEILLVVGTRSALFMPFSDLGLIIVDEEHDSSYKQTEDNPCYHARDVAVMRGKICGATVLLGSATPSLESYSNALNGKYQLNQLLDRIDDATLPTMRIVDMERSHNNLFSDLLLNAIEKRVRLGEQSLLFLNRRGFNTAAICERCSRPISCAHCSISLTFHKGGNLLACHLCNYEVTATRISCPSCGASEGFRFKGVGTERVEQALHAIFPEIRTLRLDSDTTAQGENYEQLFKQFRSGKADLLIGTQMISKGLHFPSITLVGILNAEVALHLPEFRAAEQMFQLITQVAGRAGRSSLKGEVILQTRLPQHPNIQQAASLDYPSFFEQEMKLRANFQFPPFSHLTKLLFIGKESRSVIAHAEEIRATLLSELPPSYQIYPIIASGYAKIKDHFRFQFLIRGSAVRPLIHLIQKIKKKTKIRMIIDVDPLSTYF